MTPGADASSLTERCRRLALWPDVSVAPKAGAPRRMIRSAASEQGAGCCFPSVWFHAGGANRAWARTCASGMASGNRNTGLMSARCPATTALQAPATCGSGLGSGPDQAPVEAGLREGAVPVGEGSVGDPEHLVVGQVFPGPVALHLADGVGGPGSEVRPQLLQGRLDAILGGQVADVVMRRDETP